MKGYGAGAAAGGVGSQDTSLPGGLLGVAGWGVRRGAGCQGKREPRREPPPPPPLARWPGREGGSLGAPPPAGELSAQRCAGRGRNQAEAAGGARGGEAGLPVPSSSQRATGGCGGGGGHRGHATD